MCDILFQVALSIKLLELWTLVVTGHVQRVNPPIVHYKKKAQLWREISLQKVIILIVKGSKMRNAPGHVSL